MFYFISILILSSTFLFYLYLVIAQKYKIIDKPNEIIVNQKHTSTAAGIVFLLVFFLSGVVLYLIDPTLNNYILPNKYYILFSSFFIIGFFSFYDDIKPVNPIIKLFVQMIICYASLTSLNIASFNLPLKLTIIIFLIIWVYIINISNFVDGSDGFLAIIALQFFLCIFIYLTKYNLTSNFSYFSSIIFITILISFLFFNRPIAKLYMGDVGSISIGFIIGYMALEMILLKQYTVILSSLAYPLTDCTLTLIKKMKNGHLPWARLFDYYFLIPIKNNSLNKFKLFKLNIFCNLLIFLITVIQIIFDFNYFFVMSFLISLIFINKYKNFNTI